jgi:hypothetical protein
MGTDRFEGYFFIGYAFRRELAISLRKNLQAVDIDDGWTTTACGVEAQVLR